MILELSDLFPVKLLCEMMGVQRSSFYNWKEHLINPSQQEKTLVASIALFRAYHLKYPSYGYRQLNAKILTDTGKRMSDPYAHKCCKAVQSRAVRRPEEGAAHPPAATGPMQCIVSDVTAFRVKGSEYELTLYMDAWNGEIVAHSLSVRHGEHKTHLSGARDGQELEKAVPGIRSAMRRNIE